MIAFPETCDLVSLASGLRSGNLRHHDYLQRLQALYQAREPAMKAFVSEPGRFERLHRDAIALRERYPDPALRPPLFAVPIAIDDTVRVDGFVTRAGSLLDPALLSGTEGSCVRRLRNAGALILGKTATAEFGFAPAGPTHHPQDAAQPLAMASAGAAAAVAGGLTPLAVGIDALGAASVAAGRCGVVGFSPSYQRIATDGLVPLAPSLDRFGLLAADIASIALAFRLLAPSVQAVCAQRPLAIGVLATPPWDTVEAAVAEHVQSVLGRLSSAGHSVHTVSWPAEFGDLAPQALALVATEAARAHARWYSVHRDRYRRQSAELIEHGKRVPRGIEEAARALRLALRRYLEQAMDRYRLDVWLSPCFATARHSGGDHDTAVQLPWVVSGLPSLVLPAGFLGELPAGIQLIGRWYGDEDLLDCGKRLESAIDAAVFH